MKVLLFYFNSIKVRLEHKLIYCVFTLFNSFQFHKGTIRTKKNLVISSVAAYFNSIKVRLER